MSHISYGKTLVVGATVLLSSVFSINGVASAATTCVDGTKSGNLTTTWNGSDTFTVKTKTGGNLCADVTLYGSSYIVSPDYTGGGFGAPHSAPQTLYKSVTTTLKAGTNGATADSRNGWVPTTVVVPLPDPCNNMQVDLYYAPEVTVVTSAGHGGQYIAGNIISKNGLACEGGQGGGETPETPVVPETPVIPVTPVTPVTPEVVAPVATAPAAALVDTGVNLSVISVLAAITAAAATFVATRRTKVSE